MLGNFYEKLDRGTCFLSLIIIGFITLMIVSGDLLCTFNITGVFKQ